MTGNSTTLHYKLEFLKRSWNSRSFFFCLALHLKKKKTNKQMVKQETEVEISGG